mmetsp:Transcript_36390/g.76053  ORF Transcript_36390/g.76053 Transcript_36390/m.76053 type:complete len:88 (+) Transcript_36390:46-309(+)
MPSLDQTLITCRIILRHCDRFRSMLLIQASSKLKTFLVPTIRTVADHCADFVAITAAVSARCALVVSNAVNVVKIFTPKDVDFGVMR